MPAPKENWNPVKSSNVEGYIYDPDSQLLRVKYRGGTVYKHKAVPQEVVDELAKAKSVGGFMRTGIAGKYDFEREGKKKLRK